MTTDITELAQSLKAAAEKATQGNWRAFQYYDGRCGIGGGHNDEIMVCEHISKERPHDAMFIALANPANILALVEALEKAQQRNIELVARKEKRLPVPYAYLRESDGQIQISIGAERPSDRSGGYATPWFPIYTAAGIKMEVE
ncbi:ead/Ea22-like family protein [Klebsiella pneumoniae]